LKIAALDVGGANIKVAGPGGAASTNPFELWRQPRGLAVEVERILASLDAPLDVVAVTMTGELCDCFETKAEGVRSILESVEDARRTAAPAAELLVWRTDRRFASLEAALGDPIPAAAANWLALAHLACEYVPRGRALLVDVGSTTTDIVPLLDGSPTPRALTDRERLQTGELVYTGVSRTSVASVVSHFPLEDCNCPVSSELFATTRDAYLMLGHLDEDPRDCSTADGRPATQANAHGRLARMVCADPDGFTASDAIQSSIHIMEAQESEIGKAIRQVLRRRRAETRAVIVSGSGEFLARTAALRAFRAMDAGTPFKPPRILRLSRKLGPAASSAAPAVALAMLAARWKESPA
jgi:probable H4MPT-linked C1 transfer pathway protein